MSMGSSSGKIRSRFLQRPSLDKLPDRCVLCVRRGSRRCEHRIVRPGGALEGCSINEGGSMEQAAPDRLIVALDGFATVPDALRLVDDLDGVVSFFKVGWELFMAGLWLEVVQ